MNYIEQLDKIFNEADLKTYNPRWDAKRAKTGLKSIPNKETYLQARQDLAQDAKKDMENLKKDQLEARVQRRDEYKSNKQGLKTGTP